MAVIGYDYPIYSFRDETEKYQHGFFTRRSVSATFLLYGGRHYARSIIQDSKENHMLTSINHSTPQTSSDATNNFYVCAVIEDIPITALVKSSMRANDDEMKAYIKREAKKQVLVKRAVGFSALLLMILY